MRAGASETRAARACSLVMRSLGTWAIFLAVVVIPLLLVVLAFKK